MIKLEQKGEAMNEVRGFLMIDQDKNTVLIPWDDDDLKRVLLRHELRDTIKKHAGLKELDADVRAYLKDAYHSGRTHANG